MGGYKPREDFEDFEENLLEACSCDIELGATPKKKPKKKADPVKSATAKGLALLKKSKTNGAKFNIVSDYVAGLFMPEKDKEKVAMALLKAIPPHFLSAPTSKQFGTFWKMFPGSPLVRYDIALKSVLAHEHHSLSPPKKLTKKRRRANRHKIIKDALTKKGALKKDVKYVVGLFNKLPVHPVRTIAAMYTGGATAEAEAGAEAAAESAAENVAGKAISGAARTAENAAKSVISSVEQDASGVSGLLSKLASQKGGLTTLIDSKGLSLLTNSKNLPNLLNLKNLASLSESSLAKLGGAIASKLGTLPAATLKNLGGAVASHIMASVMSGKKVDKDTLTALATSSVLQGKVFSNLAGKAKLGNSSALKSLNHLKDTLGVQAKSGNTYAVSALSNLKHTLSSVHAPSSQSSSSVVLADLLKSSGLSLSVNAKIHSGLHR